MSFVPVWGVGIRLLHWLLAMSVVVSWCLSSAGGSGHNIAGYCVAAIVGARVLWGLTCGPRSARLTRCLRAPRQLRMYLRAFSARRERRYLGHNPLGSLMVIALLATAAATCFTGWLFTTDRFWGYGWLSTLHHALAWTLVALACLHVAGVVFTSVRERTNLVAAMFTGRKPR